MHELVRQPHDDYSMVIVRGMHRANGTDRKRILSDDEIRALWTACDGTVFGALVKTALLTAQRRDKVATMQWDDIVDGEWRIASAAREKADAGSLRLTASGAGHHRRPAAHSRQSPCVRRTLQAGRSTRSANARMNWTPN